MNGVYPQKGPLILAAGVALLTAVVGCSGGGSYEALPVQGPITFQGQEMS